MRGGSSEVRGGSSEVRGGSSEVRGRSSEVRGGSSEVRGRSSEVRGRTTFQKLGFSSGTSSLRRSRAIWSYSTKWTCSQSRSWVRTIPATTVTVSIQFISILCLYMA